jgi:hypothetical protein
MSRGENVISQAATDTAIKAIKGPANNIPNNQPGLPAGLLKANHAPCSNPNHNANHAQARSART